MFLSEGNTQFDVFVRLVSIIKTLKNDPLTVLQNIECISPTRATQ